MTGQDSRADSPSHAPLLKDEERDESSTCPPGGKANSRWGAYEYEWHDFSDTLGLTRDLLPVVSNPGAVKSPESSLRGLGKTPSQFNARRQVVGFKGWTEHVTTAVDVEKWSKEPDYGICIQTRQLTAIDIDIDDSGKALEVAVCVLRFLGMSAGRLPVRFRSNSGRLLIPIKTSNVLRKSIVKTPHGTIEFLARGQQFIAAGTHPSGKRYEWANLEELLDQRIDLLQ